MEARNDWFNILLSGLPTDEQKHVLQAIAADDVRHMQHIRATNAREVLRIQLYHDERDLASAESAATTGD